VPRLFATVMLWATLCWGFCRQHAYQPEEVSLLAGDDVVASNAGQHTPGLDRFLASLDGKPGPGLAVFPCSWGSPQERRSFPLRVEPVVRSDTAQEASKATADAQTQKPSTDQRRPGPPKGRQHTPNAASTRTPA